MTPTPIITCLSQQDIDAMLHYAARAPRGAFVEVGVYRGGSAYFLDQLAERRDAPLFLFDTFTGMPAAGPLDRDNPVGKFADTSMSAVQALIPRATLIAGVFPASLAQVSLPPVSFVHADADNYDVTAAILRELPPRMVPGGFILLDDYSRPGCEGCTAAVDESQFPVLVLAESGKALVIV